MSEEKKTILYVDDEENNLISFKAAFRRTYNVLTAVSAEEGIDLLRQNDVPVVITDQRMPEMTGVQFLEKIIPEFPDSVRMILTGYSDIEAVIESINLGQVNRYILKPWDGQELEMVINNALNVYDLQMANKGLVRQLDEKLKDTEKTLELFKKYVPPSVIEKSLNAEDDQSIFEGELKDVSVLFCDIRGFSEASAEMDPKDVVEFLNLFYSLMAQSIKKYNGFINQYIGDEILAIFGAPLSYPENKSNSVYCALDMINQVKEINSLYKKRLGREFQVGIGINSGVVVAGNMGWEEKLAYSVIGSTVNIGKRIESLTREHPNSILISDTTYRGVEPLFEVNSWDPVEVRGSTDKLQVHQVINRK